MAGSREAGFITWLTGHFYHACVPELLTVLNHINTYYHSITNSNLSLLEITFHEALALYQEIIFDQQQNRKQPEITSLMKKVIQAYLYYKNDRFYSIDIFYEIAQKLENELIAYKAILNKSDIPDKNIPDKKPLQSNKTIKKLAETNTTLSQTQHTESQKTSKRFSSEIRLPEPRTRDYKPNTPNFKRKKPLYKLLTKPRYKKRQSDEPPIKISTIKYNNSEYNFSSYEWIYNEIIQRAPALKPFVRDIQCVPRPERGEINKLIELYKHGNREALSRLISIHLRVSLRVSLKTALKYDLDLEETVCEANVQLMTLIPKLIEGTNRLSFLQLQLERILPNVITPEWFNFPLTQKELEQAIIVRKTLEKYDLDPYNTSTISEAIESEIKDQFKISTDPDIIANTLRNVSVQNILSLDAYISKADFVRFHHINEWDLYKFYDFSTSQNDPMQIPFHHIKPVDYIPKEMDSDEYAESTTILQYSLFQLTEKMLFILFLRYGLNNNPIYTYQEIGNLLNLTRERIRQIEKKAIKKIAWYVYHNKISKKGYQSNKTISKLYIEIQQLIDKTKEQSTKEKRKRR